MSLHRSSPISLHRSSLSTTTRHTVRFARCAIEATVTSNAATVHNWVQSVRSTHHVIVGLDCEWKKINYFGGQCDKVATMQLCVGDKCLILQLLYIDYIPYSLINFLSDRNVSFVGVKVGNYVDKLRNDYGICCVKWVDLESLCKSYLGTSVYEKKKGLKGYASEILGLATGKPWYVTMSNWENRNLTEDQVQFGCIDAYVSYKLGCLVLL